jgi:hypothetical protein
LKAPPSDHDQVELSARHSAELSKLEQSHRDALRAMETRQRVEFLALERQQVIEQLELWRRQGRKLGPGAERVLERGPVPPRDSRERRAR